ncbi:Cytidine and deoxycytidylate deaminase zinc-binding region [compost metagenome]
MRNRLNVFAKFAMDLSIESKCSERGVAALIVDSNLSQVYSIGVNGGPKNLMDCMCVTEGKYGCVHAEVNALVKNTYHGPDKIMITTLAPCKQCAAAIINTPGGFKAVHYIEDWKGSEGLRMLTAAGIKAAKLEVFI